MIVKEFFMVRKDGVCLFRSYSTKGVYIRKVGTEEIYEEAIDIENSMFVYEETEKEIEKVEENA